MWLKKAFLTVFITNYRPLDDIIIKRESSKAPPHLRLRRDLHGRMNIASKYALHSKPVKAKTAVLFV